MYSLRNPLPNIMGSTSTWKTTPFEAEKSWF